MMLIERSWNFDDYRKPADGYTRIVLAYDVMMIPLANCCCVVMAIVEKRCSGESTVFS